MPFFPLLNTKKHQQGLGLVVVGWSDKVLWKNLFKAIKVA
jgi:hypothetical protein